MGIARICKCGHTTADHQQRVNERLQCLWMDCDCQHYEFDHTETRGCYPKQKPEPLIEKETEEVFI